MSRFSGKRAVGLDVGDKTIGVAVSDALNITAQGVTTIKRFGDIEEDFSALEEICSQYDAGTIVLGLPKNMNGTEGERCRIVREFAASLGERGFDDIVFQDERLSTVAAERTLKEAHTRRKKRKKVIDKMAAVIILQAYLDKTGGTI